VVGVEIALCFQEAAGVCSDVHSFGGFRRLLVGGRAAKTTYSVPSEQPRMKVQ